MNLFIDANIFLDFYHLSGGDIEELKKLVALLEDGKITLFSCPQLREEIKRNRDGKISDSMKEFKKANFKVSFPAFCKQYDQYKEIRGLLTEANKKHSDLYAKAMEDVRASALAADSVISGLLEKSKNVEPDEPMYMAALKRFRMGNPPGKKKVTLGDEMNWESLLKGVPDGEGLVFISGDGDYCSPVDESALNSFLIDEWKSRKKSEVEFFRSLPDFLKAKFPHINLSSDVKVNGLIERLASSGSFATTHSVIASLSAHTEFSKPQVEDLVEIADLNSQVYWIIGDKDVRSFYKRVLDKYGDTMEAESRGKLEQLLNPPADEALQPEELDDEIPF